MTRVIPVLVFLAGALPAMAQSETALVSARDLYASARYDEALAMLDTMRPEGADRKSVEQYRSLCLLALGRGSEAEGAIAAVVTADPLYQPSESEASPRVRAAFTDVRRKLLPEIATARYKTAKAAFDKAQYAEAERQFRHVLALLDDPDMDRRLGDLRMLVEGFLELSAHAAAPPPQPPPAPAPDTKAVSSASGPSNPVATRGNDYIYSAEDREVSAPAVIRQDLPAAPPAIVAQARDRGLLEIVIDEQGRVISIRMRVPMHPRYDEQVIASARDWRYQPATVAGRPVKFRKVMQISIKR